MARTISMRSASVEIMDVQGLLSMKKSRQNSANETCGTFDIEGIMLPDCTSTTSCSPACRDSLNALTSGYGCCINSNSGLEEYFTACGVDLPSACSPSFNLPGISFNTMCAFSDENFVNFDNDFFCSNVQPSLDVLNPNFCPVYVRLLEYTCRNWDGRFCREDLNSASDLIATTELYCPSVSSCSEGCVVFLNSLNEDLGCCLNQLNSSAAVGITGLDLPYRTITDDALWLECGITPPGLCESSLNARAGSACTIAGSSTFLLLLFVLLAVHFA